MKYVFLSSIVILLSCKSVYNTDLNCITPESNNHNFDISFIDSIALLRVENDLGGDLIYKYSCEHKRDTTVLRLINPKQQTIMIPFLKKNETDSISLLFYNLVDFEPFLIKDIYLNGIKKQSKDFGVCKIKKNELKSNNKVKFYFLDTFEDNFDFNNFDITYFCYRNEHLLKDSFHQIMIVGDKIIIGDKKLKYEEKSFCYYSDLIKKKLTGLGLGTNGRVPNGAFK